MCENFSRKIKVYLFCVKTTYRHHCPIHLEISMAHASSYGCYPHLCPDLMFPLPSWQLIWLSHSCLYVNTKYMQNYRKHACKTGNSVILSYGITNWNGSFGYYSREPVKTNLLSEIMAMPTLL